MTQVFNTSGLKCPLLFIKFKQKVNKMCEGEHLRVETDDKVAIEDILKYVNKQNWNYNTHQVGKNWMINIQKRKMND